MAPDDTQPAPELTIIPRTHNVLLRFGNGPSRFRPAQMVLIYPVNHTVKVYDAFVEIEHMVKLPGLENANMHVRRLAVFIAQLNGLVSASLDHFGGNIHLLDVSPEGTATILASLLRSEYVEHQGLIRLQI